MRLNAWLLSAIVGSAAVLLLSILLFLRTSDPFLLVVGLFLAVGVWLVLAIASVLMGRPPGAWLAPPRARKP